MTMDFWFGFVCGVLALIGVAVVLHLWAERWKQRSAIASPDSARLQELLRIEATSGLTTAQVVEMNAVMQRLQKAPIAMQGKTGIH